MSSRNSLQTQLTVLSIDIEDKEKNCQILRRKVDKELSALNDVEENVRRQYESLLQNESDSIKNISKELVEKSNQLVNDKASLLAECKGLVETVNEDERNTAAEVRSMHRESVKAAEAERKAFKAGYEDRLHNYLRDKLQEHKESTARGMQSEFNRLQMAHEAEMAGVDAWLGAEEKALQMAMTARLQRSVDEERFAAKEEVRMVVKTLTDRAAADAEQATRDAARSLRTQQESLDRELEKHREALGEKVKRARRSNQVELHAVQEGSQKRLADLKSSHAAQLDSLQREHEEQVALLKRAARDALARLERDRRESLDHSLNDEVIQSTQSLRISVDDDAGEGAARRAVTTGTPRRTMVTNTQGRSSPSKTSPKKQFGRGNAEKGEPDTSASVSAARRDAELRRDKQLQSEIRSLETETLRLERQLRARADEERSRIVEAQAAEESGSARRVRQLNEQLADLVVERERVMRALEEAKQREASGARQMGECRREIQVYRDGIAAQRHRVSDKEAQHKLRLRELQLEAGPAVRQLRDQIAETEDRFRQERMEAEQEQREEERQRSTELAAMDGRVTQDVSRLEEEISHLRGLVESESVRHDKLRALLDRYRSSQGRVVAAGSEEQRTQGHSQNNNRNGQSSSRPITDMRSGRSVTSEKSRASTFSRQTANSSANAKQKFNTYEHK